MADAILIYKRPQIYNSSRYSPHEYILFALRAFTGRAAVARNVLAIYIHTHI